MGSEIRRTSADDPGETGKTENAPADRAAIHMANPLLSRSETADLPDYDGPVPPPLEGADPGNEDAGEPAETTGLGEGYHSPEELRAWLASNAGDDRNTEDGGGTGGGGSSRDGGDTGDGGNTGDGPAGNGGRGPAGEAGEKEKPRSAILHAHSAFGGKELDYYSDGKDWWSGEAQAALAAQAGKEGQSPAPGRDGGAPKQWELGDNTVGENPNVQLGDSTDLRTFGEKMRGDAPFGQKGKDDDPSESKVGRSFDIIFEEADGTHDGIGGVGQSLNAILDRGPVPTGAYTVHSGHSGYEAAPTQGINMVDAVGAIVVTVVAGVTALRHLLGHNRKEHER